jgi:hypothetical protein
MATALFLCSANHDGLGKILDCSRKKPSSVQITQPNLRFLVLGFAAAVDVFISVTSSLSD